MTLLQDVEKDIIERLIRDGKEFRENCGVRVVKIPEKDHQNMEGIKYEILSEEETRRLEKKLFGSQLGWATTQFNALNYRTRENLMRKYRGLTTKLGVLANGSLGAPGE